MLYPEKRAKSFRLFVIEAGILCGKSVDFFADCGYNELAKEMLV